MQVILIVDVYHDDSTNLRLEKFVSEDYKIFATNDIIALNDYELTVLRKRYHSPSNTLFIESIIDVNGDNDDYYADVFIKEGFTKK